MSGTVVSKRSQGEVLGNIPRYRNHVSGFDSEDGRGGGVREDSFGEQPGRVYGVQEGGADFPS